jgi:acyl-coenzyme A synthetase/AMP-(fatty) acid ligase
MKCRILKGLPRNSHLAIQDIHNSLDFEKLHSVINENVARLIAASVEKNQVVWVDTTQSAAALVSYLVCFEFGLCIVPIDAKLRPDEISYLENTLAPDLVILTNPTRELNLQKSHSKFEISNQFLLNPKLQVTRPALNNKNLNSSNVFLDQLQDIRFVQFSSGTTGQSKCILLTEDAIFSRAMDLIESLALNPNDRTLCTVPLSHSHGIDCLALPSLLSGGSLYLINPQSSFPHRILESLEKNKISFFSSIPQTYDFLIALQKDSKQKFDLSHLRHSFCGSAALAESTAKKFFDHFGLHLKQGYGLAEIGVITLNLNVTSHSYGSVGQPMNSISWKLGEDGELLVKSASLFAGYLGSAEETQQRFENSYFKTEDLVQLNEKGDFFIVGRKNSKIQVLGNKFFPEELEKLLMQTNFFLEVCVVGRADQKYGEIPVVHGVFNYNHGQDPKEAEKLIQQMLIGKCEDFKLPKAYFWHREFPKSPLGKILKYQLQ